MSDTGSRMVVAWVRRELRLLDNTVLRTAVRLARAQGLQVLVVVVMDPRLLLSDERSVLQRRAFLASVDAFAHDLARRNIRLHRAWGHPEDVIPALCLAVGARHLVFARDVTRFAKERDVQVAMQAALQHVETHAVLDRTITDPDDIRRSDGDRGPYLRFTPYYRRWLLVARRRASRTIGERDSALFVDSRDASYPVYQPEACLPPALRDTTAQERENFGERGALTRFAQFLRTIETYEDGRNDLAQEQTSRLSYALRAGLLSPLWIDRVLDVLSKRGVRVKAFRRQLAWRDFYYHLLDAFPRSDEVPLQRAMEGYPYENAPAVITALIAGQTGFPIIDAGMRELLATGRLHNRMRMIVGSFATKQLQIHWRIGERLFAKHLIDYDKPLNVGGWQWCASTGTDAQPYFRLFDPVRQAQQHDAQGEYVRRFVPELASVPLRFLHAPWTMSEEDRRQYCPHYPPPVVDPVTARQVALRRLEIWHAERKTEKEGTAWHSQRDGSVSDKCPSASEFPHN